MVLGRDRILELVKTRKLIEDFSESCLEGAGYDLRISGFHRLKKGGFLGAEGRETPDVEEIQASEYILKPGEYILVETAEKVDMPENLMARVLPRSSLFRCGCSLATAIVDPGYKGALIFGLKNQSEFNFKLEKKARIAQIVFEKVEGKTKPYRGIYQGGRVV
jgi:deoxycytidine triphosphate deaminase